MSPAKRTPKPKNPAKPKAATKSKLSPAVKSAAKPYTAYLCSHTHWDREWYGTFQQFRMRLVRLVDRLMDLLERDPDFRCFNLDGQTIVLEDYLEVKPEQRPRLERLIREGRISIGPWYILPDEWLVSGESTVRNILRGRAICREFGVEPPKVGYLPDMFGHISQIPQILRGAGIDATIFWRGLSGEQYKSEVWWESPDGSRVLGFHLPESNGYANTSFFFASLPHEVREDAPNKGWGHVCTDDPGFAHKAIRAIADRCIAQSRSGVLLMMNGVDHMEANPAIPAIIRRANAEFGDVEILHSTFGEFMDALRARSPKDLQVVRGECRSTAVTTNSGAIVLPNILSSRIYLKTANARCQTLLERWAEPFSCAAALAGAEYPEGLIRTAWKWVLQNHPHDSIGGCSADPVHRQMETRFEWADEIAETVTSMALQAVTGATDTSGMGGKELAYQLFNPLNWEVTDLVRVTMDVDDTWFAANGIEINHENIHRSVRNLEITDADGKPVKFEIEDIELLIQHRPWTEVFNSTYWTVRFHVALWAEKVPAMGYKGYRVRTVQKPYRLDDRHGTGNPARMSNGFLTVDVNPNGTLDISGPALGKTTLRGAHWLEDGGDNGDGYTYSMPRHDGVVTSLGGNAQITRLADSKAVQAVAVDYMLDVPAAVTPDRQHRAKDTVPLKVRSVFRLGAGSRRIDVETSITNGAKDHRLRVCFGVPAAGKTHRAATQYDIVERANRIQQPPKDVWLEDQPLELPMDNFVTYSNLGLAGFGIHEYELVEGDPTVLKLTLLRAVNYLGAWTHVNTLQGGAGPYIETPDQQMLGRPLVLRYSIIPHAGDWRAARVQREACQFAALWRGFATNRHGGTLPAAGASFVSVEGKDIVVSSLKQAESEPGQFVLRFWNSDDKAGEAVVSWRTKPGAVWASNLAEDKGAKLALDRSGRVRVKMRAKEISTIRFTA